MDENSLTTRRSVFQLVWGIALAAVGIAVFFRVPETMPKLMDRLNFAAGQGVLSFCLYFVAVILVGGGFIKIYTQCRLMSGGGTDDRK